MSDTGVSFSHLLRLSDETGLLEHACGATPRRGYGYCVDDAARGLVVICREPEPDDALAKLAETYLALLAHAQAPDGRCRNRLSYDRRWEDEPGLGDWWGRALWGWGTAAARSADPWVRDDALECFERVRRGAGQLVAERIVGEVERELRSTLRQNDAIIRLDEDTFGISALVTDADGLDQLESRIAGAIAAVKLPARLAPLTPRIVADTPDGADAIPELAEIEAKLLPGSRSSERVQ